MGVCHVCSKFDVNFNWSTSFHSESARSYAAPFGKTRSEMGYTIDLWRKSEHSLDEESIEKTQIASKTYSDVVTANRF